MKKQTMYNRLKQEYTKLNQRIQKAMQTGRFYGYTEFKQQQLLGRLKRFSFQIKQLGAGVAVVTALGMATPAAGQSYDLQKRTGAANPFGAIPTSSSSFTPTKMVFVDIDGDGDQDLFSLNAVNSTQSNYPVYVNTYYENTGSATAPNFVLQQPSDNPLDTITENRDFAFVDIDGDGDLDLFSANNSNDNPAKCAYHENIGSSATPVFVERVGVDNPLDSVPTHLNALNFGDHMAGFPSFVDIDNDGDQDCFLSVYSYYGGWQGSVNNKIWYYENIGTNTNPSFQRVSNANNPIANVFSDSKYGTTGGAYFAAQFIDVDTDGDQDMIVHVGDSVVYHRNNGNASMPNMQVMNSFTPLDQVSEPGRLQISLVDIDGDTDFDVVITSSHRPNVLYYENIRPVGIHQVSIPKEELEVYPNPSTGQIVFEKAMTGQLNVFTIAGQKVYEQALESKQEVDLSLLSEGTYFISIEEEDQIWEQTLIIQR